MFLPLVIPLNRLPRAGYALLPDRLRDLFPGQASSPLGEDEFAKRLKCRSEWPNGHNATLSTALKHSASTLACTACHSDANPLALAKLRGDLSSPKLYPGSENKNNRNQGRKSGALKLGKLQRATLRGKRVVRGAFGALETGGD